MVMDKIKMALGLDGAADAGEVLLAVVDLVQGCACAQAELARVQEEVLAAREATADVFVEVLSELGFLNDDEVLAAARAAYVANPDAAAMVLLGTVDFVQAANPDGCNQYGHRNGHRGKPIVLRRGGSAGRRSDGGGRQLWNLVHKKPGKDEATLRDENRRAGDVFSKAQEADRVAREKVFDLGQERAKALRAGETARVRQIDREMEEARRRAKSAREELERARKGYEDAYRGLLSERRKEKSGKGGE